MERADLAPASALGCRDRWLALQRARDAANVDAVLIILGPDARFNRAADVAFNWLLAGFGGREVLDAPLDKKYEECVVCLRPSRSVVFCKRALQRELASRTSLWEACEVMTPSAEEERDQDLYDSRKVGVFSDMVADCRSIGVLVRGTDMRKELKMEVENWPLVQAYGYDEYGKGFLTLHKQVVNLELHLQNHTYPSWDLQMVVRAYSFLPQLYKAWDEALLHQDKLSPWATARPDGTAVADRLTDFFEYGRLGLSDEDISELRELPAGASATQSDPVPRILTGPADSAQVCGMVSSVGASSHEHMVWEAVDPITGVAATRTYGLSSGFHNGCQEGQWLRTLLDAYVACAHCCHHLLTAVLPTSALSGDRDLVLAQGANVFLGSFYPHVLSTPVISCIPIDAMGLPRSTQGICGSGVHLFFVRVALVDVSAPGVGSLGTVAYGDSVFCAGPYVDGAHPETPCASIGGAVTLPIPAFVSWASAGEREASQVIQDGVNGALGIGVPEPAYVALGHRQGMRIPLEEPQPFPDPLALGSVIEAEFRTTLAVAIGSHPDLGHPVVGKATGSAWAFDSGKVVFYSLRTGYILLQVARREAGTIPSIAANSGLVWLMLHVVERETYTHRVAITMNPMTAVAWREPTEDQGQFSVLVDNGELSWLVDSETRSSQDAIQTTFSTPSDGFALHVAFSGVCSRLLPGDHVTTLPGVGATGICTCIWVSGLPGCGQLDVAASLARALGAVLVDTAAVLGLGGGSDDPWPDGAAMEQAVALLAPVLRAHSSTAGVIVVSDSRCAPADVIRNFGNQDSLGTGCVVSHVVCVLDAMVAYPWNSARHPLLLCHTLRGWVNAVIVQDANARYNGGLTARERNSLTDGLVSELQAARGGPSHVLVGPTSASVIEGPLQEPPCNQIFQAMMQPADVDACAPQSVSFGIVMPLDCLFDADALQQLAQYGLAAAVRDACPDPGHKESSWHGLFCVEARFLGERGSELWSLSAVDLRQALSSGIGQNEHSFVLTARGQLQPPRQWTWPLSERYGVAFWFCRPKATHKNVDSLRVSLGEVVHRCMLRPPQLQSLWGAEDVPSSDMQRLEAAAKDSPIPPGCYFDGVNYVDVDGRASKDHPALSDYVAAFVATHNAEVQAKNAVLSEAGVSDMFAAAMAASG